MPEEEQKAIRRGIKNGNQIFKKGKSDVLTFKNNIETHGIFLAANPKAAATKQSKIKKTYLGKAQHYFVKAGVAQFLIEEGDIKTGDTILIKGTTTGEQQMVIGEMFVNDVVSGKAVSGNVVTFKLPFRVRLSDKLYKL